MTFPTYPTLLPAIQEPIPSIQLGAKAVPSLDIEHAPVDDDPRLWSDTKKTVILFMISLGAITPTLSQSIYNPAFTQLENQLHATESQLALSLSLFVAIQGLAPMFWTAAAEALGRKWIYLISYTLFIVGSLVAGLASNMQLLIGMRCVQAAGSAAVLSIGTGTLADLFEQKERGRKMGLYYAAPLLGPSLGPLVGGGLTSGFSWRATFYFICSLAFVSWSAFWFFPDTWRKERSGLYQRAHQQYLKEKLGRESTTTLMDDSPSPAKEDDKASPLPVAFLTTRKNWRGKVIEEKENDDGFRIQLKHLNPLPPVMRVMRKPYNIIAITASGFLFASQYTVSFIAAITFADAPYNYSPIIIGCVLVAFGGGNILGSILGGRYSDFMLQRLKAKNGGVAQPEMRLKSTLPFIPFLLAGFLAYAWTTQYKVMIAGPVVCLFISGFSMMLIYASALAYMVDSNAGTASSAFAMNAFGRGIFAFVMSEIALPIKNAIGDGGLFTLITGIVALACGCFGLLILKGEAWRDPEYKMFLKKKQLDEEAYRST